MNKKALSLKAVRTYCPPSPKLGLFISLHETVSLIPLALTGHQKAELNHILHFFHDLYLLKMTAMDCELLTILDICKRHVKVETDILC